MSDRVCSIETCSKPAASRGWCWTHYLRWRKYGDPMFTKYRNDMTPLERWHDSYEMMASGCWEWRRGRDTAGYGRFADETRVGRAAHRWGYERLVGPIPEGLDLDHLCRNRPCVNPEHLEPVTRQENLLRGNTLSARNAAKTRCPNGHPYSGENLYVSPSGGRRCRTCDKALRTARRFVESADVLL